MTAQFSDFSPPEVNSDEKDGELPEQQKVIAMFTHRIRKL
jgi:hypothetical protein